MRLIRALDISIELWERMTKGANYKRTWIGWKKYGQMTNDCPLCEQREEEYDLCAAGCCPLAGVEGYGCQEEYQYNNWRQAQTRGQRKKYAKLFLQELKDIRSNL